MILEARMIGFLLIADVKKDCQVFILRGLFSLMVFTRNSSISKCDNTDVEKEYCCGFSVIADLRSHCDVLIYKSISCCICYIYFNVLLGTLFSFALVVLSVFFNTNL